MIPISKNWFGPEEFDAIQRPLANGWVVQGEEVKRFEALFSKYTGAANSLACSSGTAALQIACKALGTQLNDEVIVPAFTWVATANVVELLGGRAVFCDIDLETFNVDSSLLDSCLSNKTVGIIPVHLFGLCAEMDPILEFGTSHGLWIVEDAACGLGSLYRGKHAGIFGDLGCFSFHPRKSITTGEGGMVTARDSGLQQLVDGLRNHGAISSCPSDLDTKSDASTPIPAFPIPGFNYRLTDFQGALGVAQMGRLQWLLDERARCAKFYSENLSDVGWLRLPNAPENNIHSWQSYVTLFAPENPTLYNLESLHARRGKLMRYLSNCGISTRHGTHSPPHLEYYAKKYGYLPTDYPNAYIAERTSLALPVFPGMTDSELGLVVQCIHDYEL